MSMKDNISLLAVPAKTHYISIIMFTFLFGLYYIFSHTNYFKNIETKMKDWGNNILGFGTTYDQTNENINEINDLTNEEIEYEQNNTPNNMQEVLLPF